MNDIGLAIVSAAIGAASGLAAALITALVQGRADIDTGLLAKREAAYAELLGITAAVPAWPPEDDLTYGELAAVGERMRKWYFVSGLIMTTETRVAYGAVQKAIERRRLLAGADGLGVKLSETTPLDAGAEFLTPLDAETKKQVRGDPAVRPRDDYDLVQRLFSALRTAMTEDLLSRSRPIVFGGRL